jgi:hypothetical protein
VVAKGSFQTEHDAWLAAICFEAYFEGAVRQRMAEFRLGCKPDRPLLDR